MSFLSLYLISDLPSHIFSGSSLMNFAAYSGFKIQADSVSKIFIVGIVSLKLTESKLSSNPVA